MSKAKGVKLPSGVLPRHKLLARHHINPAHYAPALRRHSCACACAPTQCMRDTTSARAGMYVQTLKARMAKITMICSLLGARLWGRHVGKCKNIPKNEEALWCKHIHASPALVPSCLGTHHDPLEISKQSGGKTVTPCAYPGAMVYHVARLLRTGAHGSQRMPDTGLSMRPPELASAAQRNTVEKCAALLSHLEGRRRCPGSQAQHRGPETAAVTRYACKTPCRPPR